MIDDQRIVITALRKSYGKRVVVDSVSADVRRGEVVGLLGPNGAGKTTTFYMVVGLVKPDAGRVVLERSGENIDLTSAPMHERARAGIGYLAQENSIFRKLSVGDNIRLIWEMNGVPREEQEERLPALLDEFGLARFIDARGDSLSGGERRRVEIARALATQPNYILLDEPLAGIDPIAVGEIRDLVSHLKDRGIGVLITDHNVRETLEIIDRAYILHDGQVLMEGRPDEVVANAEVRRVYLGEKFSL